MKKLIPVGLLTGILLAACTPPSAPTPAPTTPAPVVPDVVRSYAVTDDALHSIVLKGSAPDQKVMDLSWADSITDAAQVGDTMYATTFNDLLKIDLTTKTITTIGGNGVGSMNALTVDANGNLYGSSIGGTIYKINPGTGVATKVLSMGYTSSGDLAFAPDGTLYATVKDSSTSADLLARMKVTDTKATLVGSTGFRNVYGLDYLYGTLYGRTNSGQIITLNTATGAGTLVRETKLSFTSLK